jgi:hypothetical protein
MPPHGFLIWLAGEKTVITRGVGGLSSYTTCELLKDSGTAGIAGLVGKKGITPLGA